LLRAPISRPFGRQLSLQHPPLCPEIVLWLLGEEVDLEAECRDLHDGEPAPYWAFCWGSGQALARFVLDHPSEVENRCVVDFGSGSGVAAIAAAKKGARRVVAVDRDRNALEAAVANAEENGVSIETSLEIPSEWDLLLASDVLYEPSTREIVSACSKRGRRVLVSEPDRPGAQGYGLPVLQRYSATTLPDVDSPTLSAGIYRLNA